MTETENLTQKFIIVHCSLKEFNKNFKKNRDVEIINYHDVMAKLENNDVYKNVPDRSVIEYYIVKRINNVINGNKVSKIYYFLENLELDVIKSIKRVIGYQENLEYELMLIDDDDIDDIKHEFDTIQIINHDKA
jgi:hypothetical protein